jgi:7 transmembrane receptor (rhodopsin family)
MGSLAVCDILLLVMTAWVNAIADLESTWTFGSLLCKLQSSLQPIAGDCSICTIAIISLDRSAAAAVVQLSSVFERIVELIGKPRD